MASAIGLLLGGVQLLVWLRMRDKTEFLLASVMAIAAAVTAICEARFFGRPTPETVQAVLEIQNIAIGTMLVSMTWFVRFRLNTGRLWLAWAITATWVAGVILSIASPGNLTFVEVTTVDILTTPWGKEFGVASGVFHPFKVAVDLASLAIMAFVADASVSAFRAGRRRVAVRTGGSILFFIIVAGIHTPLVDAGVVKTPYVISLAFVAITISLALDLVDDVARAARLNTSLMRERQRWNVLTQTVDLAVIRVDGAGNFAYVNPFFERISGTTAAQLVGTPASELVDDLSRPDTGLSAGASSGAAGLSRRRGSLITASGDRRDLIWFSAVLKNEDGSADGYIAFGQDVTSQLRAEDEARATRQEIERLTRAVALGELSSSLAHELSQPVAAILSNTQTLQIMRDRSGQPKDETDEILADIYHDSRRARDLMIRMRGFMLKKNPEAEVFDLSDAASEVIELVSGEALKSAVEISVRSVPGRFPVLAARLEIQQVLMNLLLNSIQATGTVGDPGRIEMAWREGDGGEVIICVGDNGPGMKPDLQETVFDPFVTTKASGIGIGLAVSRRIVERHGGTIRAGKSDLGGAEFVVTLPIAANGRSAGHG